MANASIGGIISGLDTATIINQLMQLESRSQNRLKTRVSSEQGAITALQALNTKLSSIATKAAELSTFQKWAASTATSTSAHVTTTTSPGAAAASLTFTVQQLATHSQSSYTTTATMTAAGVAPPTIEVTHADGTSVSLDVGTGSLKEVAAAINGSGTGLTATLVRAGMDGTEPTYRLSVSSAVTGADTGFTISANGDPAGFLGGVAGAATVGQNAQLVIDGMPGVVEWSSNTFENLMPQVSVTLGPGAKPGDVVTVTVAPDAQALSDKVKALVDAVNAAVADIDTLTNYNTTTKKAGLAGGDPTLRSVRDQLLATVVNGVDSSTLFAVGIEVDRSGKLTFDATKFAAAHAADPAATADLFVAGPTDGGLATSLETLAKRFSNSVDGVVTNLIGARTSAVAGLNDAIVRWDDKLALRRTALERQYGALEVALGKLQSQSSWLAGQIGSLPSTGS